MLFLTRSTVSFTVQSRKPDSFDRTVFAVALPQPEKPEKGKKPSTSKQWEEVTKKWLGQRARAVTKMAGKSLDRAFASGAFKGNRDETLFLPAGDDAWLLLVGLGPQDGVEMRSLLRAAALAMRKTRRLEDHRLVSLLHEAPVPQTEENDRVEATTQGFVLGSYKYDAFTDKDGGKGSGGASKKKDGDVEVTVLVVDPRASRRVRPIVDAAVIGAEGQLFARDLTNTPPNVATPDYLAKQARTMAREEGLTCKVMGVPELKQKKMTGILAVGQGSDNPPRLIMLKHKPKRNRARTFKRVVVVGKGITFDTGGISIKPSDRMELMKFDKSGACTVIALMRAVARADLGVEVIALAACAENMPSGGAYRPGDILTMGGGKTTVEVLNTDAEGRMVLADALHYAGTLEPDAIVDVATLTGAIDVALGSHYSGLMSTDDELVGLLEKAGTKTGERVWRMPIGDDYQEQIKGYHSDLVNIGGRSGGALTAGQFLANFVPEEVAWAHMDVAGTAWDDKPRPENVKGATGVSVRLLYRFLKDLT